MKSAKIALLLLFSLPAFSLGGIFHADLYGSFLVGNSEQKDQESSTKYTHDALAIGVEAGGRLGFNLLSIFQTGAILSYSSLHFESDRQLENSTSDVSYDNTFRLFTKGLYLGVQAATIKLWVEYYAQLDGKNTYADPKAANPYAKEDEIKGTGLGAGVGIKTGIIYFGAMLKMYQFDKFVLAGQKVEASDDLDELEYMLVSLQAGLSF